MRSQGFRDELRNCREMLGENLMAGDIVDHRRHCSGIKKNKGLCIVRLPNAIQEFYIPSIRACVEVKVKASTKYLHSSQEETHSKQGNPVPKSQTYTRNESETSKEGRKERKSFPISTPFPGAAFSLIKKTRGVKTPLRRR
jgi:hypothetical protein